MSHLPPSRFGLRWDFQFPLSHTRQPFFLLVLNLIARPPCAIAPLPVLRDMVQVGFDSAPWNDANANEFVL